jgi:hypothetical protein
MGLNLENALLNIEFLHVQSTDSEKIFEVFLGNSSIMAWCPIRLKDHSVENIILKMSGLTKLLEHTNIKVNSSCDRRLCKKMRSISF